MIGLVDCDNFFCSCERVFRPDLARKPVVVLSNNDGCVVARSREVKALGIPEGMPYYQLLEQYPDAGITAFSSNYTLYGDMSARVMAVLRSEVPEVVQYSIDEAFLLLDGLDPSGLKEWGERLCSKVQQWTGMPVSLGIASSKTLAKMASKFAKNYPGYRKCCVISSDEQREAACRIFPIGDVWGIGRHTARALLPFGVTTAYGFASLPQEWVRRRFHITGERTWRELRGDSVIDVDNLDSVERKSIVTSRSFPSMITSLDDLRPHVANYAARCAMKLRRQHSVCSMLTVFVQSNCFRDDQMHYSAGASRSFLTPTSTTGELVAAAGEALDEVFRSGVRYKRAGVMVTGIGPAAPMQPALFGYDPERSRKLSMASAALDSLNRRLGADTVTVAAQQYSRREADGRSVKFAGAIRRALKSPDYTTSLGAFTVA